MPLEALRYPVTPVGLHYLLIHYDVPYVDADTWSLTVRGKRELTLGLDDLKQRPRAEATVTMECAGNGRARLDQANAHTLSVLLSTLARETGAAVVCATHDPVVIEHADAQLSLA